VGALYLSADQGRIAWPHLVRRRNPVTWFTLQSLLVILPAFGLGMLVGWLSWGRRVRAAGGEAPGAADVPFDQEAAARVPVPAAAVAAPSAVAAPKAPPRRPRGDDLERIEGIGPNIADALHSAGLSAYADLAGASEDILRTALRAKNLRFAPSLPTWPKQARLLADGDEDGFAALNRGAQEDRDSSTLS
jgi:predicted flap endonuclease-1-like 5' DNA nuclease